MLHWRVESAVDNIVRRRSLPQRFPLMARLAAGFSGGFAPQTLRSLLCWGLLQAVTRWWAAARLTVEADLSFQRTNPLLKCRVYFNQIQISGLKISGTASNI